MNQLISLRFFSRKTTDRRTQPQFVSRLFFSKKCREEQKCITPSSVDRRLLVFVLTLVATGKGAKHKGAVSQSSGPPPFLCVRRTLVRVLSDGTPTGAPAPIYSVPPVTIAPAGCRERPIWRES